jgi:glycosyltransferase involved in cell wall biosynthesis
MKKELVKEKKICVVYNPINKVRIDSMRKNAVDEKSIGIATNELVIGIVANIRPVKDYETFVKAAKIIHDRIPNSKFLIIGSDDFDYKKKIDSLIIQEGLKEAIIFTGPIENPIPLLKLFHVGVLTSKSEGLSNALIEYGATGIPAVATDVGGNGEIINDHKTGFLVPPGSPEKLANKIIKLLTDSEMRIKFGANACKQVINKFDQNEIIRQYDEVYRSILIKSKV